MKKPLVHMLALLTRMYPLYSGCGTLANHYILRRLVAPSSDQIWAKSPGGNVLVSMDDLIGRAVYLTGDLDPKITWICKCLVGPGDTVLDIGANIGIVTLLLASLVGKSGRVIAFEPNPILCECLRETFEHNKLNNIELHPVALGDEKTELELCAPKDNVGKGSLVRRWKRREVSTFSVPVTPLADVLERERVGDIRFIKLDVEGFEAMVLKGAMGAFVKNPPQTILFESNNIGERPSSDPAFGMLQELSYSFFSIPRCFVKMKVKHFDPVSASTLPSNDFLAVHSAHIEDVTKKLGI